MSFLLTTPKPLNVPSDMLHIMNHDENDKDKTRLREWII